MFIVKDSWRIVAVASQYLLMRSQRSARKDFPWSLSGGWHVCWSNWVLVELVTVVWCAFKEVLNHRARWKNTYIKKQTLLWTVHSNLAVMHTRESSQAEKEVATFSSLLFPTEICTLYWGLLHCRSFITLLSLGLLIAEINQERHLDQMRFLTLVPPCARYR